MDHLGCRGHNQEALDTQDVSMALLLRIQEERVRITKDVNICTINMYKSVKKCSNEQIRFAKNQKLILEWMNTSEMKKTWLQALKQNGQ